MADIKQKSATGNTPGENLTAGLLCGGAASTGGTTLVAQPPRRYHSAD
jgi:hypothetical protein